jgi:outer membrane protein assembly factor BamB
VDLGHSGAAPGPLALPLMRLWTREVLPQSEVAFPAPKVSFPIIVGDRIFAQVWARSSDRLVAVDRRDGSIVWESAPFSHDLSGDAVRPAYDSGRLFTTEMGLVKAIDAATGTELWQHRFSGMGVPVGPPSAAGGIVFVERFTGEGILAALDGSSGSLLWERTHNDLWDIAAPLITATAVFVNQCCDNTIAFQPLSGRLLWTTSVKTHGAGWNVPALYQGRLFNRGTGGQPTQGDIVDATNGQKLGTFRSLTAPAFHDGVVFFVDQGALTAQEATTGTVRWIFRGDGAINTAPLVVAGHVYVGSERGTLYAVDEVSGTNRWSDPIMDLAPATVAPSLQAGVLSGFNVGRSTLVVTTSRTMIAYGGAP